MAGILLVYASTHGHTAKIAARMAETLRAEGLEVDMRDVKQVGDADPARYDAAGARPTSKSRGEAGPMRGAASPTTMPVPEALVRR